MESKPSVKECYKTQITVKFHEVADIENDEYIEVGFIKLSLGEENILSEEDEIILTLNSFTELIQNSEKYNNIVGKLNIQEFKTSTPGDIQDIDTDEKLLLYVLPMLLNNEAGSIFAVIK